MKVFQVIYEDCREKEVKEMVCFVTHRSDDISKVCEHYKNYCAAYEFELKSVRELLVISEHIND